MSAMSDLFLEIQELIENDVDPQEVVQILVETRNMDHRSAQRFVTDVVNHCFEVKKQMTGWRKRQITELGAREKCVTMLASLFPDQPELQEKWWTNANKAFNGSSPLEILDQNPESVLKYLYCQFSGDFS